MSDQDLESVLRGMAADALASGGGHLTADELVDYHAGGLTPKDRDRVQEHLAACPECAGLLLDISSFQEPAPAASEFEVAAVWRGVRERTGEPAVVARPSRSPRWLQAVAASLLVATVALSFRAVSLGRQLDEARQPQINAPVQDLRAPSRGAGSPAVTLDLEAGTRLFTLVVQPASREDHPDYEAALLRADGSEVWRGRGLRKNRFGSFTLTLSRDLAGPGSYVVRLFGLDGERRVPLGEYTLRINAP